MNKIIFSISIVAAIFIISCTDSFVPEINNFEECIAAGNPAMESYPRQCRANDQTFVEETLPEPNLDDDRLSELCVLEPDLGPCEAAMPRYYFDGGCKQFFWGGCQGVVPFETFESCQTACEPKLSSYFNDQIISKGVEKIGQPIEGFDAFLLKRAFPGLKDEDFDNAEALLGIYKIVDDELMFQQNPTGPIHSAAQMVSKKGMETLMDNAATRLNIEIINQLSVDKLLNSLEK